MARGRGQVGFDGARAPSSPFEGAAARGAIDADEVDRASKAYWDSEADAYQAEHAAFLAGRPQHAAFLAGRPELVVDPGDSIDRTDYQKPRTGAAAAAPGFVWGPEGLSEAEAGLLGPLEALVGRRVLEVGCGAAQCSRWLAERGVRAVGIDIAIRQLRHATPPGGLRRVSADRVGSDPTQSRVGPSKPDAILRAEAGAGIGGAARAAEAGGVWADGAAGVRVDRAGALDAGVLGAAAAPGGTDLLAASATALPFRDATFEAAFASYGAIQFVADLTRLLAEVRRVLRPGGRWVFSVTHPIRWAFPDDPGPAGLTAAGSYFERTPYVERDGSGAAVYAEFHRTIGDYVAVLTGSGFVIETLVEPEWPDWNDTTWGGWSPLRGTHLPGTLIIGCRADGGAAEED